MPKGFYKRTEEHRMSLRVPHIGAGIYDRTKSKPRGPHSEETHLVYDKSQKLSLAEITLFQ